MPDRLPEFPKPDGLVAARAIVDALTPAQPRFYTYAHWGRAEVEPQWAFLVRQPDGWELSFVTPYDELISEAEETAEEQGFAYRTVDLTSPA